MLAHFQNVQNDTLTEVPWRLCMLGMSERLMFFVSKVVPPEKKEKRVVIALYRGLRALVLACG